MKNTIKNVLFGMIVVSSGACLAMSGVDFKFNFYADELPGDDEVVFLERVPAKNLQPMEIVDEVSTIAAKLAEFSAKRHASARTRSFGTYAVTLRNLLKDAMISEEDRVAILETYNAVYAGLSNVNTRSAKRINALLSALKATLAQGRDSDDSAQGDYEIHGLDIVIKKEKIDGDQEGAFESFSEAISSASIEQQSALKDAAVGVLDVALGSGEAGSSSVVENSNYERSYKKLFDSLAPFVPSRKINRFVEYGIVASPVALAALVVLACDKSLIEESLFVVAGFMVSGILKYAALPVIGQI